MQSIPMVDLKAQYDSLKEELDGAIAETIAGSAFIGGAAVERLETEFAGYCGARYACGVGSGSDALAFALAALGIGHGDEVITTPFTFIATSEAITRNGARVVFADVDPRTFNSDPAAVAAAVTPRTRAILAVHLYGHPAELEPLLSLAGRSDIAVVEDAAQAHGALYQGRRVGTWGRLSCFSFFPSKNLGAYGDGGMVVSNDGELVQQIRRLSNHGSVQKYHHQIEGYCSRLDGLQAAILRVKLRHLDRWNERRREVARLYREALAGIPGVTAAEEAESVKAVYHVFTIRFADRDGLRSHLAARGIAAAVHYPKPLHLQEAYAYLGLGEGAFPVAERAAREVLSLPMFPELTEDQVERIAREVRAYAERSVR